MAYEFVEEPQVEEGALGGVARGFARQASNIGTRALGIPGDIFSLINEYIARPATEAITGEKGLPYEETFLGKAVPTTEFHRKGLESVTGEYLKPQDKVEQFVDDVVEDTALLLSPSKLRAPLKLGKSFLQSLGANVAGEAVRDMGAGEQAASATKGGALFLSSLISPRATAKSISDLYKKADASLPKEAKVSVSPKKLDALEVKISQGRPRGHLAESEKFVLDEIDKAKELIHDGSASIPQILAQKRSLNEALLKQVYSSPDKAAGARARKLSQGVKNWYSEVLENYGKKNPEFIKAQNAADEATATLHKSKVIGNWVEKNSKNLSNPTLLHLFGIGASAAGGALMTPKAAIAFPAYKSAQMGYKIAKSPTLRKIYANALGAAAKEDSKAFVKYYNELNSKLEEEEGKDQYEFVD